MTPGIILEVALVNKPNAIRVLAQVLAVPSVGDFLEMEAESPTGRPEQWFGYVGRRRFEYRKNRDVIVRVWLQQEPP